jgi:hypothetical protein
MQGSASSSFSVIRVPQFSRWFRAGQPENRNLISLEAGDIAIATDFKLTPGPTQPSFAISTRGSFLMVTAAMTWR